MKTKIANLLFKIIPFFLLILTLLTACNPGGQQQANTKPVNIKGNVQITNNCGGTIPDPIRVVIIFRDANKSQVDTDTADASENDGLYPFKKTSTVHEDAETSQIKEILDANNNPVCGAAVNHNCKSPQTCKKTAGTGKAEPFGNLMLYDLTCGCTP